MASNFFSHRISLTLKFSLLKNFEACPTQLTRITQRPWGVSDLKFFTDDDCFEPIDGGGFGGGRVLDWILWCEWWEVNFGVIIFSWFMFYFCLVGREKP